MRHTSFRFTVLLSLFVLLAGAARATVIVDGTDTGQDSYTVTFANNQNSIFTGSGTLVKADDTPNAFTGSLTGFDGTLKITGQFWTFGGSNMVKGDDKDLELSIFNAGSNAIFKDPDSANPISFKYSVLNGVGGIRTSNGTQVKTCTLVVGTNTKNYTPANENVYSGNITKYDLIGGDKSDFALEKVGTNTQVLSGNNSGLSSVTISGGVLESASKDALGSAPITMNGGTLRLTTATNAHTYTVATESWSPSGTFEVYNNSTDPSWTLDNYPTGENINFIKTGAGTVVMSCSSSYGEKSLKSAEIKEGKIQITGVSSGNAQVFPASATVTVYEGATVEYQKNTQDRLKIPTYSLEGGTLDCGNMTTHLTTGNLKLYGGIVTGANLTLTQNQYGDFLFDEKIVVGCLYNEKGENITPNKGVSSITGGYAVLSSRGTRGIEVQQDATLNMNISLISHTVSSALLEKYGDGVLNLTKANTYTEKTNINEGTLKLSSAGTLGNGTGDVTVKDGATLEIANTNEVSNYISLNGVGYDPGDDSTPVGALYFSDSGSTSGDINIVTSASIGVAENKTGTISGKLYGGAGTSNVRTLTKVGKGTLKFTSEYNTIGSVTINNGTVSLAEDAALDYPVLVNDGGSLEFAKSIETDQTIKIKGTGYNGSGALRILADSSITYNLTLEDADATVYVAKGVTGSVTTGLYGKSSVYTLTKTGEGTLSVSTAENENTIKGVVVKEGVYEVASANALGGATAGNNVKMDGGTLKLTMDPGHINFDSSTTTWNASGTFEVYAAKDTMWTITNTFNDAGVSFVKTGEGTTRITGDHSDWAMKSVEIKEGTLRIYVDNSVTSLKENWARVFPKTSNVKVYKGATVEYTYNPQNYDMIPAYTLYGGELESNMSNHLITGEVNLYGGTLTGSGNGSVNYGNFLFDKNITVYPSKEYGNTSAINAKAVQFAFRGTSTKAINVQEGAQLDVNAVIKFYQGGYMATSITKEGDGVLNFTRANTYALPTNINAGTLKLSDAGTLGAANQNVTVNDGATLEIANTQTLANPLTISGTGSASAGAVNFTASSTLSSAVTLAADSTINVATGVNGTLSGSVAGTFTLTKTGPGTLTIDKNCAVASDLTVSEGTLNLSGTVSGALEVGEAGSAVLKGTSSGGINFSGTWLGQVGSDQGLYLTDGEFVFNGDLSMPMEGLSGGSYDTLLKLENGATFNGETDLEKIIPMLKEALTEEAATVWDFSVQNDQIVAWVDGNKIPEPATWVLFLLGAVGLGLKRRVKSN